jgi:DNA-directed RNA polymerase specialized sigma24 family protein
MTKELNIQTIRQAQAGNKQSLSAVAEQVRQKVYTYIYRLTLDYHLTQDLTQETVLEMIKALPQLEVPHVNGFWGWIFRTAIGHDILDFYVRELVTSGKGRERTWQP